ncbi:MAG: CotH kinase family protein [Muribaculaceae bacterium]|nr:CotH kinase family protein [Muribaculaceae bacterium]
MKLRQILTLAGAILSSLLILSACSEDERVEQARHIVINELMASNRTGILTHKGKADDWIELKNMSGDTINLKDFQLQVERLPEDSITAAKKSAKKDAANSGGQDDAEAEVVEAEKEEKDPIMTWSFPDVKIPAGETLLVFVGKKSKAEKEAADDGSKENKDKKEKKNPTPPEEKSLRAEVKLPKEGGIVRFLSPRGTTLRELKYGRMEADRSLALQSDSTYQMTYLQSPGFENTREGYEAAMQKMADQRKSPLLIWEVMGRAEHSYENWVELKNVSNGDVNLGDYSLGKKINKKNPGWKLPDMILKPGEIVTITLAGQKRANGGLRAPFKLGSSETIVLGKDGKFMDGVCVKTTPRGVSMGRMNGKKGFFYFSNPTRNAENGTEGRRFIAADARFDHAPGVYEKADKLTLKLKDPKQKIHYTLNGSLPTAASPLLKDSIVLTNTTTIRTFTEGDSLNLRGKVNTMTYILGAKHDLPVVNITVNNADLYDFNTGIYANGPGYGEEWPHPGANFWKSWTKGAHVEMFDNAKDAEGFSVDCGLKIFGGFSRNEDKKSFRLKFRGRYGDPEVDYDFFGDSERMRLEDLVLRSGSQDWMRCMIRDEFFTSLMQQGSPTLLTQKYRPVALYINGSYFGLYYLREKIDKEFVARKLGVSNDDIDILMSVGYLEEGSKTEFSKLMNYVQSNNMKDKTHYQWVKDRVDLQGLIDFKLGEMYAGNSDVGNVRYVRSGDPKSDGKWRFVYYDLDATWVGYTPTPAYYLSMTGGAAESNVTRHNLLINRLLENPEFRQLFLERLGYHMNNTFSQANAEKVFDALVAKIRPEMELNCKRWPKLSYKGWEKNIGSFREKFKDKHLVMYDGLRQYLKITPEEEKKYKLSFARKT